MDKEILAWGGFIAFVVCMLILDLGLFQRKAHEIKVRESLLLTAFWVGLALLFNLGIYWIQGPHKAFEFLTGYLIEESLSVDNIFVFLLIFNYFSVPPAAQRTALFWGILGAIVLRAVFIITGLTLIAKFHWLLYFFGGLLIWTGIKMVSDKDKEIHPERNPVLKIFRKFVPTTAHYEGNKFFVKRDSKYFATPLFVVLLVIETTDLVFAVDSIPAIFSITLDPFIVYTSNIFAILGLRALYFTLAGVMKQFHYLSYGLAAILVFVGVKMLISDMYHIPIVIALSMVAGILILSIATSMIYPKHGK
ncbi:MAG: tellurium resistance protein TerC [Omnitrophica bacterium RIFCSPHIGHO2_02_FULL_46_11]|nr:MAG: tellurium resistance protein TerC [Omnitrophica bacterium RIFCSPHIGHO2_02_FULL_46_11]OGW87992.1 MAG: tellurium resistance protein TerC [Omnitrophica bacterium RIFCSPLOWO2_01_FULL_45_10b]